jgi:hypothetical protein
MIILPRKTLPGGGRTTLPSQDEPASAAQRPTFEGWGPRI